MQRSDYRNTLFHPAYNRERRAKSNVRAETSYFARWTWKWLFFHDTKKVISKKLIANGDSIRLIFKQLIIINFWVSAKFVYGNREPERNSLREIINNAGIINVGIYLLALIG